MKKVFVSYKFRPEDEKIANYVKQLIESHTISRESGEDLLGEALQPAIHKRIEDCDGLIALLLLPEDQQNHHRWIYREFDHAESLKKRVITVVERGFEFQNLAGRELIYLDRADPVPALLKLSQTLGGWHKESGRRVTVRLTPDNVARLAARDNNAYSCSYRLFRGTQPLADWQPVKPEPLAAGIAFEVDGFNDDLYIRVRVNAAGGASFSSVATPQMIAIDLKEDN